MCRELCLFSISIRTLDVLQKGDPRQVRHSENRLTLECAPGSILLRDEVLRTVSRSGSHWTVLDVPEQRLGGRRTDGEGPLKEVALRRYDPGSYRFCPNADCAIVYFDDAGRTFRKDDLRIAVWQKEPVGSRMICYCFNETEATIRVEIERSGTTNVIQRVRDHIAAGRCACAIRNPRGACCLGDVAETVKRFTSNV